MDLIETAGQCNNGYACVYQQNLSWSAPTWEAHPKTVFERLFGEGGGIEDRRAALREQARLRELVRGDISRLKGRLGHADRVRVDNYLTSIRDVERQIQRTEAGAADNSLPDLDRPKGVPAAYADHAKLMFDHQLLTKLGDIKKVVTFQLAWTLSDRTYAEVGVPDPHHPLNHHGNDPPEKVENTSRGSTGSRSGRSPRISRS